MEPIIQNITELINCTKKTFNLSFVKKKFIQIDHNIAKLLCHSEFGVENEGGLFLFNFIYFLRNCNFLFIDMNEMLFTRDSNENIIH